MESSRNCPLCESTGLVPAYVLPNEKLQPENIWQCATCYCHVPESCFDAAIPMNEALQVAHHEDRWRDESADVMQKLLDDLKFMVGAFKPHFGHPVPDHTIVELGCGRGGLLKALLDSGYNTIGCEPGASMVALARRHYGLDEQRLSCQSAESFLDVLEARGTRPYAIVLWHVLEHVRNPLPLLERCARMLGPDGRLILQLPMVHPPNIFPEHYFFFTTQTVRYLSRRLGNLPFYFSVDLPNMFLSVFFGDIYKLVKTQMASPYEGDPEREFAAARSEPINYRHLYIGQLRDELARRPPIAPGSPDSRPATGGT